MVSHLHQEMELEGTFKTLWLDYIPLLPPDFQGPGTAAGTPPACPVCFFKFRVFRYIPPALGFYWASQLLLVRTWPERDREEEGAVLWFATT